MLSASAFCWADNTYLDLIPDITKTSTMPVIANYLVDCNDDDEDDHDNGNDDVKQRR